jgi:peroxiredoxin
LSAQQKAATEIVAIAVDPRDQLQRMVDRVQRESGRAPDFPFLSDPGHRVINRYGLYNENSTRPVPHPTTLIIDKAGVVRWKVVETDYRVRPTNEQILAALADVERGG